MATYPPNQQSQVFVTETCSHQVEIIYSLALYKTLLTSEVKIWARKLQEALSLCHSKDSWIICWFVPISLLRKLGAERFKPK
jgi:hypothetical protein